MSSPYFSIIFTTLIPRLPVILVLLAGLIIALVRWKRHRAVSILMIIIFVLETVIILPLSIIPMFLAAIQNQTGISIQQLGLLSAGISIGGNLISALAWALAVVAILGWRTPQSAQPSTSDTP